MEDTSFKNFLLSLWLTKGVGKRERKVTEEAEVFSP